MYKKIINRLISYPQRGQIKIDFDLKKKIFRLTVPIYSSKTPWSHSVKTYVEARKACTFKPHVTSFQIGDNKIHLVQEIPFSYDFQSTLRRQVNQFWDMSRHCRQMFVELAIEEKYKTALHLDSHFGG